MNLENIRKRLKPLIVFGAMYLSTFFALEQRDEKVNIIETEIDTMIPFCEYFIVPYVLWYLLVAGTVVYFMIHASQREYESLVLSLAIGMIIFVIVSFVYPNGHNLRPVISGDNVFQRAVKILYTIDTSTNILPSLHVFNTIVCYKAILNNHACRQHNWLIISLGILSGAIILSTMFLKQHSVVDVVSAIFCNAATYHVVYNTNIIEMNFKKGRSFLKNV